MTLKELIKNSETYREFIDYDALATFLLHTLFDFIDYAGGIEKLQWILDNDDYEYHGKYVTKLIAAHSWFESFLQEKSSRDESGYTNFINEVNPEYYSNGITGMFIPQLDDSGKETGFFIIKPISEDPDVLAEQERLKDETFRIEQERKEKLSFVLSEIVSCHEFMTRYGFSHYT